MKKTKHKQKNIDDDIDILPEENEEDFYEVEDEVEPETTDEITEESFYRFKDNLPSGNDWE